MEQSTHALAEEEASRAKAQISNIWDTKLERRKDAYWNYTKNKRHNETNTKWLNSDHIVIPQYLQRKQFNEQPDQRKLREAAVLHDFKTETDLRGLRATHQHEKVNRLDSEMETLFQKKKCNGNAAKLLSETWKKQVSQNENISHRRWLKSEKWLTTMRRTSSNFTLTAAHTSSSRCERTQHMQS